jgi:ATP dependent DNA ligase C terminal region
MGMDGRLAGTFSKICVVARLLFSCTSYHHSKLFLGNRCSLSPSKRYSPFLMACYNLEAEEFQSVCRVMSGFSDAFYKEVIDMLPTYHTA